MEQFDKLVRRRYRRSERRRKKRRFALRLTLSVVFVVLAVVLSAGIVRMVERPVAPWQGQADLPLGFLEAEAAAEQVVEQRVERRVEQRVEKAAAIRVAAPKARQLDQLDPLVTPTME